MTKWLETEGASFAFKEMQLNESGLTSTLIKVPHGNFIRIFDKIVLSESK